MTNLELEQLHWDVRQRADHQERSVSMAGVSTLKHTVLGGQYIPYGLSTATAQWSKTSTSFSRLDSLKIC